jgi:hypothetical protein
MKGANGGEDGMLASLGVTSGGSQGTSGGRRVWLVGVGLMVAFTLVEMIVNAESVIDEFRRMDRAIPMWQPWTWEASSAVGWLAVMPLIALAALRLRPPRLSWPATVAVHLTMTVPVSLAHVGIMVTIRHAVHGLMGGGYRLGPDLGAALLYEWRKDAVDYLAIALAFALIDWIARRADGEAIAAVPAVPPARLKVRDGSRATWLVPADILWVQAAGNYVELHTAAGPLLHRTSLVALERKLAPHGFARIHRSRLVRREAVRAVETNASGDFEVALIDGARVSGSRRYRGGLGG